MFARQLGPRPEDRRDAAVAFLTLFGVMTAHAVLETARDALFLSRLPATELPWTYIAIAGLSLVGAAVVRRFGRAVSRRVTVSLSLAVGGGVTAAFRPLVESGSAVAPHALYVWTGLLASVVVVEFWLLVAQLLDIGQAKRVFTFIGAGGLLGAIVGAALAYGLLIVLPPAALVTVAGGLLALTAIPPLLLSGDPGAPAPRRSSDALPGWLGPLRSEPYLRRLLAVAAASSVLLTGVDFVFKATAAVDLAPDQLGPFFARFYATTGVIALFVQLFLSPRLLRVLGVNGSLLLLPALLLLGSTGFVLVGGLGAAILLRGADGALRHSLNRTGTEILYVPLVPSVRERAKALIEAIGQRGGQALGSVLLLVALATGARPTEVGVGLIVCSVVWLGTTAGLRPHYLELFRRNLRRGALETHVEVPDLDLHSLEALIGALGSENDLEVLAALDLLATYGKTNLVPALILYHPSPDVVLRAFAIFAGSGRQDVGRLLGRLIDHDDERIRAAALRYSATQAETSLLESMSNDPSPLVRTTAVVELIRRGAIDEWKGGDVLRGIIDGGTPELRRALALAARDLPPGRYGWALIRLAFLREPGLAVDVARSMAAAPDVEYVPTLVRLLADRESREPARAAVLGLGEPALGVLARTLEDPGLPRRVRRHVPPTIARLGGAEAARVLERRLPLEADEVVALKIARALGRLRATDPSITVDRKGLLDEARTVLKRSVTLLYFRTVTDRLVLSTPEGATPSVEMLSALLSDMESSALERVFRLLTVIDPSEEFEILFAGLRSEDPRRRENGRELLSHIVPEPVRGGILAMLGDGTAEVRLTLAARFHEPPGRARLERVLARLDGAPGLDVTEALIGLRRLHVECLRAMLLDPSDALRGVARHRLGELGELGEEEPGRVAPASEGEELGALAALSEQLEAALDIREPEASRAG